MLGIGLVVAVGVWFFLSADNAAAPTEPLSNESPDTATSTPVDDADGGDEQADEAFPRAVTENVIADIVATTAYTAAEVTIDSVTAETWRNGCLGLAEPGEMCTQALVNGFEVRAEANGDVFIYRTDSTGATVRRAE